MWLKVPEEKIVYSREPEDGVSYTEGLDRSYSKYARAYDIAVKWLPVWKTWIKSVLPHIEGPGVLEASFGTGYLLMFYAGRFETHGIDYNSDMVEMARENLSAKGLVADLQQANVEALPFGDGSFDTVVNTMAFSGYANGFQAMSEFCRVLKVGGRLLLVDFDYPANRNRFGVGLTRLMVRGGDTIRDLSKLMQAFPFDFSEIEIGGFGSVHLYVAIKQRDESDLKRARNKGGPV